MWQMQACHHHGPPRACYMCGCKAPWVQQAVCWLATFRWQPATMASMRMSVLRGKQACRSHIGGALQHAAVLTTACSTEPRANLWWP